MSEFYQEAQVAGVAVKTGDQAHLRLILALVALCLALILLIMMSSQMSPSQWQQLAVKADVIGITSAGKEEQARVYMIKRLGIPSEQREVLARRMVFLGCSKKMAMLAIGLPIQRIPTPGGGPTAETWIYHFETDPRPTMLEFVGDELARAYKGSTLEVIKARDEGM